MAVEVYFWPPHGTNIGHASIKVDGGSPKGEMYLSAWPGSVMAIVVGSATYNEFLTDVSVEGGQPATVRLTKLDETEIKSTINSFKQGSTYSFPALNCATQASICLNAGVPGNRFHQITDAFLAAVNPLHHIFQTSVISTPWTLYAYALLLAKSYA